MAVNQHVFQEPVILAQVGNRWQRDWQPSPFRPRQQATQSDEEEKESSSEPAQEMEFVHPEDDVKRQTGSMGDGLRRRPGACG
jgi:hypothetical protein